MGMYSLASILFQPLAGLAIDRAGPRRFLILEATLGAMTIGVVAGAWGYPVIYGVACAATLPAIAVSVVYG